MQKFFLKVKSFCFVFCTTLSLMMVFAVIKQKVFSDFAFEMDYPEVVFENDLFFDKDSAVALVDEVVSSCLNKKNLASVDIKNLKDRLLSELTWIEKVAVVRDYPDTVKLFIKSKEIVAYKFEKGEYFPLTDKGEKLNMPVNFTDKIVVDGRGAENNVVDILDTLKKYPLLLNRVVAMQFVNELRWNLIIDDFSDGIVVKLDNDFVDGVQKLAELDVLYGILSKNISVIDLRSVDNFLVRIKK